MKFYNPFKPHIVVLDNYKYAVRVLELYFSRYSWKFLNWQFLYEKDEGDGNKDYYFVSGCKTHFNTIEEARKAAKEFQKLGPKNLRFISPL